MRASRRHWVGVWFPLSPREIVCDHRALTTIHDTRGTCHDEDDELHREDLHLHLLRWRVLRLRLPVVGSLPAAWLRLRAELRVRFRVQLRRGVSSLTLQRTTMHRGATLRRRGASLVIFIVQ